MKRAALIRHLRGQDCELVREGSRHSIWANTMTAAHVAVPRHNEIDNRTAKVICRQLGIPDPPG